AAERRGHVENVPRSGTEAQRERGTSCRRPGTDGENERIGMFTSAPPPRPEEAIAGAGAGAAVDRQRTPV
ncbi:MAG: hypothetical protein ACNA8S_11540, partial [Deferrisomatales bacterium]